MRSAVCRCLAGAWRSASRIWWMTGRKGPSRGLARGALGRNGGGSSLARILLSVCQWRSYSRHASRLLISPVSTRRRISAQSSMSVYTPASCRAASDHGRDPHRTAGGASERYTSGSAAGLRQALHFWVGVYTFLGAVGRLVALLDTPGDVAALAPLV